VGREEPVAAKKATAARLAYFFMAQGLFGRRYVPPPPREEKTRKAGREPNMPEWFTRQVIAKMLEVSPLDVDDFSPDMLVESIGFREGVALAESVFLAHKKGGGA